jgi:hypothetical protein
VAELTDFAHLNHNAVRQHLGVRRTMGLVVDEVEIRDPPSRLRLAFRNTTADNAIRGWPTILVACNLRGSLAA